MSHPLTHPILLVDDDQELLLLMKTGSENEGCMVLVRTSAPCRAEIDALDPVWSSWM